MTDNLEQEIRRGERAQSLLDDALFQEIVTEIEQEMFQAWRMSGVHQTEVRESAFRFIAALDRVVNKLHGIVANGKTAAAKVAHENEARRFERRHGYRPDLGEVTPREEEGVPGVVPGAPM